MQHGCTRVDVLEVEGGPITCLDLIGSSVRGAVMIFHTIRQSAQTKGVAPRTPDQPTGLELPAPQAVVVGPRQAVVLMTGAGRASYRSRPG